MAIIETYEYPLMKEWSIEEIVKVSEFYTCVEQFYTTGVDRERFLKTFDAFKKIEPSISVQKQLDKRFFKESNMSIYQAIKSVQKSNDKKVYFKKSR